jgi:hypothetical protein
MVKIIVIGALILAAGVVAYVGLVVLAVAVSRSQRNEDDADWGTDERGGER